MPARSIDPRILAGAEAAARLDDLRAALLADRLIPYLGPGLIALADPPAVPHTPAAVAAALHARAPAPARIRTDMWAVAQFIEQRRHRQTLIALMAEIFAPSVPPSPLHRWLARHPPSLIVDTWYDDALRAALLAAGDTDWMEIQGITRAGVTADLWSRVYDPDGNERPVEVAEGAGTVVYRPHGGVAPAKNFLVADSDYVEVLTEIDIQTPIPEVVKTRRATRGFLFLGCRFDDQILRIWARQLMKRSEGPRIAVAEVAAASRNERAFYAEQGIEVLDLALAEAVERLVGDAGS